LLHFYTKKDLKIFWEDGTAPSPALFAVGEGTALPTCRSSSASYNQILAIPLFVSHMSVPSLMLAGVCVD